MKLKTRIFLLTALILIYEWTLIEASSTPRSLNAASELCIQAEGTLETMQSNTEGEIELCTFGKASIETCTLFHQKKQGLSTLAVSAFCKKGHSGSSKTQKIQIANPASRNCLVQGGVLEILKDPSGNELGVCHFIDGSTIEEWTLFRGCTSKINYKLKEILNCPS